MSTTPGAQVLAVVGGVMAAFDTVSGLTVLDYAVAGRSVEDDAVVVGEQVGALKLPAAVAGSLYDLEVTVTFRILSVTGSALPTGPMQRVADILDGFVKALEADDTFGGTVSRAVLGPELAWAPDSDEEGGSAELTGTVVARKPIGP